MTLMSNSSVISYAVLIPALVSMHYFYNAQSFPISLVLYKHQYATSWGTPMNFFSKSTNARGSFLSPSRNHFCIYLIMNITSVTPSPCIINYYMCLYSFYWLLIHNPFNGFHHIFYNLYSSSFHSLGYLP